MQAVYSKKLAPPYWDTVNIKYPIKKFPNTDTSSETVAHRWRNIPEVLKSEREPIEELRNYLRDYNITKELTQSQSTEDFGHKSPDIRRHNKHTSSSGNQYIYPPCRKWSGCRSRGKSRLTFPDQTDRVLSDGDVWSLRNRQACMRRAMNVKAASELEDRPPQCSAHGTTEMRNSYTTPLIPPRLVTNKDQYKRPVSPDQHHVKPSFHKELEPLDTTHDGYEKYLDPYLTTSRLHHRPFTAEQLNKESASKNIATCYTLRDTVWVRTPRSKTEDYCVPPRRPKSMYDREKFKQDFREIRTHNKPRWLPGTFRTECRENYTPPSSNIGDLDGEVRTYYLRSTAQLPTNISSQLSTIKRCYNTENSVLGSKEPICSMIDQHVVENRRLENMIARARSKVN